MDFTLSPEQLLIKDSVARFAAEPNANDEHWATFADRGSTPQDDAETGELMTAIRDAIESELTSHQREILVAITLNDVPIDVLAERLSTTRGALYKTLHDARRKLRAHLAERDLLPEREMR